jgi:HTH-type transcriptional regulator/antitoxin HipB
MYIKDPKQLGAFIKELRKKIGITQKDVALTTGIGLRFIIELEQGKPTCQLAKVLQVLHILGIKLDLIPPQLTSKSLT